MYNDAVCSISKVIPDFEASDDVKLHFHSYDSIRTTLYRRQRESVVTVRDAEDIPYELSVTLRSKNTGTWERWLLETESEDKGVAIFASDADIEDLARSPILVMDGTFKVVPRGFVQLYVIHGRVGGQMIPLCHSLMRRRDSTYYTVLFEAAGCG